MARLLPLRLNKVVVNSIKFKLNHLANRILYFAIFVNIKICETETNRGIFIDYSVGLEIGEPFR